MSPLRQPQCSSLALVKNCGRSSCRSISKRWVLERIVLFAVLVHERFSDNGVLMEMARIVQAADFKNQLDDHPAARGLQLISHGFPMVTSK
jgi:hypothetical protein